MPQKQLAVLDIGTKSVKCLLGKRGVNNIFECSGLSAVEYAGFLDGEFLEETELTEVIFAAVNKAKEQSGTDFKHIFIGVPAEFCMLEVRAASKAYPKRKKITPYDIEELFDVNANFSALGDYSVLNRSPVYFELDDGRKIIDPVGQLSSKLSGTLSYILAETHFTGLLSQIMQGLGLTHEFVSEQFAQALYLIEPEQRDAAAILIDCGYLTTSLSVIMGDGLVSLNSFSLGGGHITGDLYKCLELPFSVCEELKRRVVLSVKPDKKDFYEVLYDNKSLRVEARKTNDIILARIDQIAQIIKACLDESGISFGQEAHVFLTGGGLTYLKGAKEILSTALGMNVDIIAPSQPQLNKPNLSSAVSLLGYAAENAPQGRFGLLNLFKKN